MNKKSNSHVAFLILSTLWSLSVWSNEPFPVQSKDLISGTLLEGSVSYGGGQPNYIIDYHSPTFQVLVAQAKVQALKVSQRTDLSDEEKFWKTITEAQSIVQSHLPGWQYAEAREGGCYRALMAKYTITRRSIRLSKYLTQCGGHGVCRENAMLLHGLLKELGMDTRYISVLSSTDIKTDGVHYLLSPDPTSDALHTHCEEHSLVVVRGPDGNIYSADSYNNAYNGYRWIDLLKGVTSTTARKISLESPRRPSTQNVVFSRVVRVHSFPRVLSDDEMSPVIPRVSDMNPAEVQSHCSDSVPSSFFFLPYE